MGIYSRYTTAFLIILATIASPSATAATLHPVPSIAKALAAGPTGVMPSGLTVLRSQQLGTMLLKSQVQLAIGSATVPVVRGASLSVPSLAKSAVQILKNSSPPKIIAGAVVTAAIAALPGSEIIEGEFVRHAPVETNASHWKLQSYPSNGSFGSALAACESRLLTTHVNPRVWLTNQTATSAQCWRDSFNAPTAQSQGMIYRIDLNCPYGHTNYVCNPEPQRPLPFTEIDWIGLEDAIVSTDPSPDAVRDFWFDICSGNPSCLGSYAKSPTLEGPSSLPSTQTTTTSTGPNGTTTTTKTTQTDLDYSNPDGVVSRDKTTTTTTNPDGSQSTDITEDTGPVVGSEPKDELEEGTFNDSPFPDVEPFYERKYPDGLEGVWNTRSAEFKDSAFMDFLGSFVPSFSGSCPAWSINVNIASWANFGVHDFQTLCWVFDFIKVVLLVSAAFLCRALMFGG